MKHSIDDLQAIIKANIGDGQLGVGDLDRIRVPAGGGTTWEIPSLDGETSTKNFDGVIAGWKEPRAYWAESFASTGGGTPPDCSSENGYHGIGHPGGSCADCEFAQFGSAVDEKGEPAPGQACNQMRIMAIIQKDDLIPLLLSAPATSIANLRRYFLRLASAAVPYYGVVTRFTLAKAQSQKGIPYAKIEAKSIERLEADEAEKMKAYAAVISKSLERQVRTSREDYEEA